MSDQVTHPIGEAGQIVAEGGRRLAVQASAWLDNWYVSHSPRNDNCNAEGPWADWVTLAREILRREDERLKTQSPAAASPSATPATETHGYGCPQDGEPLIAKCEHCCPHGWVERIHDEPCPKCVAEPTEPLPGTTEIEPGIYVSNEPQSIFAEREYPCQFTESAADVSAAERTEPATGELHTCPICGPECSC